MELHWVMLPLVLFSLALTVGIARTHYADQPPPLAREFYRPHWEWERSDPTGRRFKAARTCVSILFALSLTSVFVLAFLGISLPWF